MDAPAHSMETLIRRMTPVAVPPDQRPQVAALFKALGDLADRPSDLTAQCRLIGPDGESIVIPESVFHVLERVVEVLARGDAITVVPVGRELTTQQAANLLNVSRQYLVRLLNEGALPFRTTGKHRRLQVEDVLAYKEKRDRDRRAALRVLSQMSEDLGGYD